MSRLLDDLLLCYEEMTREYLLSEDAHLVRNVRLKHAHTRRVLLTVQDLCREEMLSTETTRLAELAALLHDWSRFEQFRRYHTYNDGMSEDHGDASAEMIFRDGLLPGLPDAEVADIADAVRCHNKLAIPAELSPRAQELCRIVRDGDKLDIFSVLLDYLQYPDDPAVTLSLKEGMDLTPAVVEKASLRLNPPHQELRTKADFILTRLLWAYDLNYRFTARMFLKENLLPRMRAQLPPSAAADRILQEAIAHLQAFVR